MFNTNGMIDRHIDVSVHCSFDLTSSVANASPPAPLIIWRGHVNRHKSSQRSMDNRAHIMN